MQLSKAIRSSLGTVVAMAMMIIPIPTVPAKSAIPKDIVIVIVIVDIITGAILVAIVVKLITPLLLLIRSVAVNTVILGILGIEGLPAFLRTKPGTEGAAGVGVEGRPDHVTDRAKVGLLR